MGKAPSKDDTTKRG